MNFESKTVAEALSEYINVSQDDAVLMCEQFTNDGTFIPANEPANTHINTIAGLMYIFELPNITESMIDLYETDSDQEESREELQEDSHEELREDFKMNIHDGDFFCPICFNNKNSDGVKISCDCQYIFCKNCITTWLTKYKSSCPMCRRKIET